jgi:hypothetical protein
MLAQFEHDHVALNWLAPSSICQMLADAGIAYSHRIPLAGLKCLSEKRRLGVAARLGEGRAASGE